MRLHPQLEETLLIRTQPQIIDQPPLLPPKKKWWSAQEEYWHYQLWDKHWLSKKNQVFLDF